MTLTLLAIVNNAQDSIGIPRTTSVVGSTDVAARQMLQLANIEGAELVNRADWEALRRTASFSTVASVSQGALSSVASDIKRIIPDTMWNETEQRFVRGGILPKEQQFRTSITSSPNDPRYYIQQGVLYLTPTPAAGETVTFRYQTDAWCEDSGGTGKNLFSADTDVLRLPSHVFTLGLIWRWRRTKGLDYAEDFRTYENAIINARGNEEGGQSIYLDDDSYGYSRSIPAVETL